MSHPHARRFFFVTGLVFCLLSGCASTQTTKSDVSATAAPGSDRAGEFEAAAAARSSFVGEAAPTFALPDQDEKTVRLADLRGQWVVLYFYPKDDTPGCTCQATEFTEILQQFRDRNARVIGISADSPKSHRYFRDKYDLKITLLTDYGHDVMRRYAAYATTQQGDQTVGRVIRSTVIVDPTGQIAAHYPEVMPEGHAARVMKKLAELQSAG